MLFWWVRGAFALDCDPAAVATAAWAEVAAGNAAAAVERIDASEPSFACGDSWTPTEDIARLWLIEGAARSAIGDELGALDALSAARRVAPDLWLDFLPGPLRMQWVAPAGEGTLTITPPLGPRQIAVDGTALQGDSVSDGLHVIQIADPDGGVVFARVVFVAPGTIQVVETGLEPITPPPTAPPSPSTLTGRLDGYWCWRNPERASRRRTQ